MNQTRVSPTASKQIHCLIRLSGRGFPAMFTVQASCVARLVASSTLSYHVSGNASVTSHRRMSRPVIHVFNPAPDHSIQPWDPITGICDLGRLRRRAPSPICMIVPMLPYFRLRTWLHREPFLGRPTERSPSTLPPLCRVHPRPHQQQSLLWPFSRSIRHYPHLCHILRLQPLPVSHAAQASGGCRPRV